MVFRRIEHNRTADAVIHQIEEHILAGVMRSGDKLPGERELARMFDISRPVLRDAIKSLEERGLVVTRHGEGSFIADITGTVFSDAVVALFHKHPSATADYIEFRREVEATAAALAAKRATAADRTILSRTFEAMLAAHDRQDFDEEARIDVEFHNVIGECTHNLTFVHTLRSCYRLLTSGVFFNRSRVYGFPGARERLLDQHRAIYEAIMEANPQQARRAASAHMEYVDECVREIERLGEWEEIAALRLQKQDAALAGSKGKRPRKKAVTGKQRRGAPSSAAAPAKPGKRRKR